MSEILTRVSGVQEGKRKRQVGRQAEVQHNQEKSLFFPEEGERL
jgi:hypothetical protein